MHPARAATFLFPDGNKDHHFPRRPNRDAGACAELADTQPHLILREKDLHWTGVAASESKVCAEDDQRELRRHSRLLPGQRRTAANARLQR